MSGGGARSSVLTEFFAHNDPINCACISGIVFATGADDCRVHLWRIDEKRQKPLMTLVGHSKPVDSVLFDGAECKHLAAGSRSGTLRRWNLASGKVCNIFAEHRASVGCIAFHTDTNVVSTGSRDTNIKLWDVRKRSSVMTLKGHNAPITVLKHSPDGAWALTGDESGILKIWDLQQQKTLHEWNLASGITSVAFHPMDMDMAVSTELKKVRFFDLQTFNEISQTTTNSTRVHKIAFHKDGKALLSASSDGLKSWGWHPKATLYDFVDTQWKSVKDMAMSDSGILYSVSVAKNVVTTTAVKLYKLKPFGTSATTTPTVAAPKPAAATPPKKATAAVAVAVAPQPRSIADRTSINGVQKTLETRKEQADSKASTLSRDAMASNIIPQKREKPIDLSMSAFLPQKKHFDPKKVRDELSKDSVKFTAILAQRKMKIKVLRTFWCKGDIRAAVESLVKMNDRSVAADFLKHTQQQFKPILTLDICKDLLPTLGNLIRTRFEDYIATALAYMLMVLKSFSRVIKNTLSVKSNKGVVNPQFEDRRERCQACKKLLQSTVSDLRILAKKGGR